MTGAAEPTTPPSGSEKIANWIRKPATASHAQRILISASAPSRPPSTNPTRMPIGIEARMSICSRPSVAGRGDPQDRLELAGVVVKVARDHPLGRVGDRDLTA